MKGKSQIFLIVEWKNFSLLNAAASDFKVVVNSFSTRDDLSPGSAVVALFLDPFSDQVKEVIVLFLVEFTRLVALVPEP